MDIFLRKKGNNWILVFPLVILLHCNGKLILSFLLFHKSLRKVTALLSHTVYHGSSKLESTDNPEANAREKNEVLDILANSDILN